MLECISLGLAALVCVLTTLVFYWRVRAHRAGTTTAGQPGRGRSPPRVPARAPQPYALGAGRVPLERSSAGPARRRRPTPLPATPWRVAALIHWRRIIEDVFERLDVILAYEADCRKAKAIQDQWASWIRYGNVLRSHPWETLREPCGCKGRQRGAKPGLPARGHPPS